MRGTLARGLTTGAEMAAATTTAVMIASWFKQGSPWAGVNAMATAVGAGGRRARARFDPTVTPVGLALLVGGLLGWGVAYEGALSVTRRRRGLLTGALSAALGYAFDKAALPSWVVPNFRRTMGLSGTIAKYMTLAAASARLGRPSLPGDVERILALERSEDIDAEAAAIQRPPADS